LPGYYLQGDRKGLHKGDKWLKMVLVFRIRRDSLSKIEYYYDQSKIFLSTTYSFLLRAYRVLAPGQVGALYHAAF
jgi:hypothetical protein